VGFPLLPLPVVQHWDCQATGTCCKEYRIKLTEEERHRIEAQRWDADRDLGGHQPFRRVGWWQPATFLNRRADGSCVFLSPEGRCRIHERHGYESKPLACRLFPFVLVPVADHWRTSLRFACPSAAASVGRSLADHTADLSNMAEHLARRENLSPLPDGTLIQPPPLDGKQSLGWPGVLALTDRFLLLLRDRRDALERRWRKCLRLVEQLRQSRLDQLSPTALEQTLTILTAAAEAETSKDPHHVAAPSAVGRVIFRLIASLYTRKGHGPNRGVAAQGRLALMRAALRFARGVGPVPRMHRLLPEITFDQGELPQGPLAPTAQEVLERYYLIKVGSVQFCGPACFDLPFWEGLQSLAVTVPLILWVTRLFRHLAPEQAAVQALTIIDDHFGFNPLLASRRMRLAFRLLARRGETARLTAWYSR
jgi:lysine-N-methylase